MMRKKGEEREQMVMCMVAARRDEAVGLELSLSRALSVCTSFSKVIQPAM